MCSQPYSAIAAQENQLDGAGRREQGEGEAEEPGPAKAAEPGEGKQSA